MMINKVSDFAMGQIVVLLILAFFLLFWEIDFETLFTYLIGLTIGIWITVIARRI